MKKTASLCASILLLIALPACTLTKQAYLAKGNKLFAAGKYPEAVLNYRKAIQKDPAFGEAYYRWGLAAIRLNQASDAYQALFRANQLLPRNLDAQEKFAEVCLDFYLADSKRPEALYTQLQQLSDQLLSRNSRSYEALVVKGYLAATDQQIKPAIDFFHRALDVDSSNAGVVAEMVRLLNQDGQAQQAEALALDLIVRQKASYGPIYDLLYGYYMDAGRAADAENVLTAKVNNNPAQAGYVLQLARHYHRLQEPEKVKNTLDRLLNDPKAFPEGRLSVGDFYLQTAEYDEAIRYYQQGAQSASDPKIKLACQNRNVVALLGQGKREEALGLAAQVLSQNPKDDELLRLHAGILLDSGKREHAAAAVREFQILSGRHPEDASLRLQLGRAYRLKGDLHAGEGEFLEAIKRQRDLVDARYELAEVSLLEQLPTEAVQQAKEILALRPNDRRARLLRTAGLIGTGDAAAARVELDQLIKESPKDAEPRVQLGLLALAEHKTAQAIELLNLQRADGDPRVFAGLAAAYLNLKQRDRALEVLNQGLAKAPDSLLLTRQLGAAEAMTGHYDQAIAQFQKLLAADPQSADLHRQLGEVYGLEGDHGNEIQCYQQAYQLEPGNLRAALALADALGRGGRTREARTLYQNVVQAHPDNAVALNNAAYFLAETGGDLDEALRLAQRAVRKAPGQPVFSDTIGYIYLKKGLQDSAIHTFSTLARMYPSSAAFRFHLGMALYEKGDKAAARRELEAALADHPNTQEESRIRELLGKTT